MIRSCINKSVVGVRKAVDSLLCIFASYFWESVQSVAMDKSVSNGSYSMQIC